MTEYRPVVDGSIDSLVYRQYNKSMTITWDVTKDAGNVKKHGVSLRASEEFDWSTALIRRDTRREYGEPRFQALGFIGRRLHMLVFAPRGDHVRVISLRKANRGRFDFMSSIRRNRAIEDDENPAWGEDEFDQAQPAADVLPGLLEPSTADQLLKPKRGRPPKTRTKEQVSMRLDRDVLAYYRSLGRGWQTEINAVLRRSMQRKRR